MKEKMLLAKCAIVRKGSGSSEMVVRIEPGEGCEAGQDTAWVNVGTPIELAAVTQNPLQIVLPRPGAAAFQLSAAFPLPHGRGDQLRHGGTGPIRGNG